MGFMAFKNQLISAKKGMLTVLALFIICSIAVFTNPTSYFSRILEIPRATTAYFVDGTVDTGIDERLNWYTTGFKQSFDQPIYKNALIGHGLGSTSEIDFSVEGQPVLATTAHPHNAYIQNLYEGGLIGLCLFLWLIVKIASLFRTSETPTTQIVGISCVILWACTAFFDGGQNSGRVLALLLLLLCFGLQLQQGSLLSNRN